MKEIIEKLEVRIKHLEQQNNQLTAQNEENINEIERINSLVNKILPYEIAHGLMYKGSVNLRTYRKASVLFANFEGFSEICNELDLAEVLQNLNMFYSKFDEIIRGLYVEKIKTMGDTYMCAGGVPLRNMSNPVDILLSALEMRKTNSTIMDIHFIRNLTIGN